MKKGTIWMASVLAATIALPAGSTLADSHAGATLNAGVKPIHAELESSDRKEVLQMNKLLSVRGTITEISERNPETGIIRVTLEGAEGQPAVLVLTDRTYVAYGASLKAGMTVTGYYDGNSQMIMIYPPQYTTEAVIAADSELTAKAGVFDDKLVSEALQLKLHLGDHTEIVTKAGEKFEGSLAGRKLLVYHGPTTKSIPAQTTPSRIVVLDAGPHDVMVNGSRLRALAYTERNGVSMVPLRAVAEQLGYKVSWNEEDSSVTIGNGIGLSIGKDDYSYMKTAPIQLGQAPVLKDGMTYVPLAFFDKVIRGYKADIVRSVVVINKAE